MNNKYIELDNVIYKLVHSKDNTWQVMTHIKSKQFVKFDFDVSKYYISANRANQKINAWWDNQKCTWTFRNESFSTLPFTDTDGKPAEYTEQAKHTWGHTFRNVKTGEEFESKFTYYLVWNKGHLYWMNFFYYYPQCCLFKFDSIEKEPRKQIGWTKAKHLRVVRNITRNVIV